MKLASDSDSNYLSFVVPLDVTKRYNISYDPIVPPCTGLEYSVGETDYDINNIVSHNHIEENDSSDICNSTEDAKESSHSKSGSDLSNEASYQTNRSNANLVHFAESLTEEDISTSKTDIPRKRSVSPPELTYNAKLSSADSVGYDSDTKISLQRDRKTETRFILIGPRNGTTEALPHFPQTNSAFTISEEKRTMGHVPEWIARNFEIIDTAFYQARDKYVKVLEEGNHNLESLSSYPIHLFIKVVGPSVNAKKHAINPSHLLHAIESYKMSPSNNAHTNLRKFHKCLRQCLDSSKSDIRCTIHCKDYAKSYLVLELEYFKEKCRSFMSSSQERCIGKFESRWNEIFDMKGQKTYSIIQNSAKEIKAEVSYSLHLLRYL